ncbi:MAG: LysR family transcriptional regulator [Acidovorax sp.]|nr:LysR family transcriptional regulator [Acidovorax sp.]
MRMHSPSLSELHAFAAAAQLGSFSQAAEALNVTQGAISRAIARLEEHLGLALFTREGRRSVLTHAGSDYLDAVGPSITTIESATRAVRMRRTGRQLRVSVTPTLFSHWLIPRLPDFSARHPDITLSFAPYRRDDPLTAPEIDAWVRIGTGDWPAASIAADYIVGRELVPICRPADLLGPGAIRAPQDLLARPLLAHTNYPDNWAAWFDGVGCAHPPIAPAADFEQVAMLVQAVIAGLGVAVVQRCLVEEDLAAGRIAIAIDRPVALDRGYYLCRPAQRPANGAFEAFRAWLLGQAGH